MNNNKFKASEAAVLVYGPEWFYMVYDCNNKEQLIKIVSEKGKPTVIMDGFVNIEEMKKAKRCYAWMMTTFDCAMDAKEPSEKEKDWFFEKQMNNEWFDLKDVVEKYDSLLPDSPDRYKVKI